jgi:hypothetical protein
VKRFFLFCVIYLTCVNTYAQVQQNDSIPQYKTNIGIGIGLDYGGFGFRVGYMPIRYLHFFGAAGYNLAEIGYNVGITCRILPKKKICPTVGVIYGYNAVIVIKGYGEFHKTYYGPTITAGFEFRSWRKKNFINLEILFPFRSIEFDKKIDEIKSNPQIKLYNEPLSFTVSIGYHFAF